MTADELAARLRGVLHDSSKSTRLLYWQAARKRQGELKESRRAGNSFAITPLDEPLRELDEALFGEERRRRQEPYKRFAQAADEVAQMCLFGRYEVKSYAGLHVAKSGGHARPSGASERGGGTYSVAGFAGSRIADVRAPTTEN